jgi:hypothetical protein
MECPVCLEYQRVVKILHVVGERPERNGIAHCVCAECHESLEPRNAPACPVCRHNCPGNLDFFVVPMVDGVVGYKSLVKLNGKYVAQYPVYETAVDSEENAIDETLQTSMNNALTELANCMRSVASIYAESSTRIQRIVDPSARAPRPAPSPSTHDPPNPFSNIIDVLSLLRNLSDT